MGHNTKKNYQAFRTLKAQPSIPIDQLLISQETPLRAIKMSNLTL